MAYKKKTKDCYAIEGNCGYGWDIECNCEDRRCKSTVKNIQRKCELSCTNQKMERKKRKRGKLKWQNLKI